LDHLFVDQDAIPTLVEAKRGGNPEARREVVAQLIEYAANGTLYWPIDEIRSWLEDQAGGMEPARESIATLCSTDASEESYETFWNLFGSNLKNRRIRLVFVADEIPSELRTLVEFLNEQMELVEVLAVEVAQYSSGGRQILKPQLIGQTATAKAQKRNRVESVVAWDWDAYRDVLHVSTNKLEIGEHLFSLAENSIAAQKVQWRPKFNKGYISFQRDAGYNVVVIDFWWNRVPRLKIKLPAPVDILHENDPLSDLDSGWDAQYKEFWWSIPALETVTNLDAVIELAARHQPAAGPMTGPLAGSG